jgi:transcriptional regulator with XRE-family HTH domain
MAQLNTAETPPVAISKEERGFFVQLGARIGELRRSQSITQVQLAATLEVSQQTMNAYEMGHRRVPVSALPTLARALGVSVEELIGEKSTPAKRGPAPQLQQKIERLSRLSPAKQRVVLEMLDGVLMQASR